MPAQRLRQPGQRAASSPTTCARELGVPVCISAEVSPQIREYPRMVTTACNAATMPVIGPYLDELQKWLAAEGFGGSVLMMLSNGGVVSADDAARVPIRLVESGPAAGALAGSWFAAPPRRGPPAVLRHGRHDRQGVPHRARRARPDEHVRGRPHLPLQEGLRVPGVGAVGRPRRDRRRRRQSIARIDQFGLLKVGPESAGADPGPASLRPRRHRAGGHRRRPRARPARPGRASSAATCRSTRAAARRALGDGRPTDSASTPSTPPPASTRSSTRTWPPRRGCTPSSRASTCAASPCSRSAAPGRCTPAASPSCSSRDRVVFPVNASVLSAFGTLVSPVRIDLARSMPRRLDAIDADRARRAARRAARRGPPRARRGRASPRRRALPLRARRPLRRPGQRGHRAGSAKGRAWPADRRRRRRPRSRPSTGGSTA